MTEPAATPELAKITIAGGIEIQVPKEQAEKFHAAQQKHNAEREELAKRIGAIDAERKAAEEKAANETRDKEAMRLANDGHIEKAREIFTKESNAKLQRVTDRLIAQEIRLTARKLCQGIDDSALDDMVTLVRGRAAFDAETEAVTFCDDSGNLIMADRKPAGADAFLAGFLAQHKHFQPAKVPASMNGQPARTSAGAAPRTMTSAEYDAAQKTHAGQSLAREIAAGTLKIIG